MAIHLVCSACGKQYDVADHLAGKRVRCKCGTTVPVPDDIPIATAADDDVADGAEADVPTADEAPSLAKPKKKKGKKRDGSGVPWYARKKLLVRLTVGLSVLGSAVLLFLVWWLMRSSGPSDEMPYLPDRCEFIARLTPRWSLLDDPYLNGSLGIAAVVARDFKPGTSAFEHFAKLTQGMQAAFADGGEMRHSFLARNGFENVTGLNLTDLDSLTLAGSPDEWVVIIKHRERITAQDVKDAKSRVGMGGGAPRALKYKEYPAGQFTVYEELPQQGYYHGLDFCAVGGKRVLFGRADVLQKLMARAQPPNLSAGLRYALENGDGKANVSFILDLQALLDGPTAGPALRMILAAATSEAVVEGSEAIEFSAHEEFGGNATLKAALHCKDDKQAAEAKKLIEAAVIRVKHDYENITTSSPFAARIFSRTTVVARGRTVRASLQVSNSEARKLFPAPGGK